MDPVSSPPRPSTALTGGEESAGLPRYCSGCDGTLSPEAAAFIKPEKARGGAGTGKAAPLETDDDGWGTDGESIYTHDDEGSIYTQDEEV